jgi:hypothetical protein
MHKVMNRVFTLPVTLLTVCSLGAACAARDDAPVYSPPRTSDVRSEAPDDPEIVRGGGRSGSIPVGQEIDVRLRQTLSSENAYLEQRFETTTVVDLVQDGRVLVPAGSVVKGIVSDVDKAGRVDRDGSLTLTFDRMRVGSREHEIHATATEVFESRGIRDDAGIAGVGAGVGAVVGGVIAGVKGAILGAVIGAGGTIAATEGKDVRLPAGSIVRIRLDSPVRVG